MCGADCVRMVRMGLRAELKRKIAATDAGHARFITAFGVAAGVLLSAGWAWTVVHVWHGDSSLLAVGAFLAMQMGIIVKDTSAKARLLTTALAILPLLAAISTATLLSRWRPVEIAVFVLIAGAATWVRRFGPRATALGIAAFFGYFFAVFLKPTLADLPGFFLVAAGAIGAQTLVRALMLLQRPRRQIALAFTELRSASEAAIAAAVGTGRHREGARLPDRALRMRLARIADVSLSIRSWQQRFDTGSYVGCDEPGLDELVLQARIDIERACAAIVSCLRASADPESTEQRLAPALDDLRIVLDNRVNAEEVAAAGERAEAALEMLDPASHESSARGSILHSTLSHRALRRAEVAGPAQLGTDSGPTSVPAPPPDPGAKRATPPSEDEKRHWWAWRDWNPSTRMAVQVMVAASLATFVGELISASRWYWAVLTAFLVFVGTSTRADALTRGYRRVWGTALGILVGFPLVLLAHGNQPLLTAMCVAGVFSMLYFGPLQYGVRAFSVTIMLVSMYGLLGILNVELAALRVEETAVGAVTGVLCAYLIFSLSSRPALAAKIDGYVDALSRLLEASRTALVSARQGAPVLEAVHELDRAQSEMDQFVSSMSVSFVRTGLDRVNFAVHLMYSSTRAADQFAQAALAATTTQPAQLFSDDEATALDTALARVRSDLSSVRTALGPSNGAAEPSAQLAAKPGPAVNSFEADTTEVDTAEADIADLAGRLPYGSRSPQVAAMLSLARLSWLLREFADRGRPQRARRHAAAR